MKLKDAMKKPFELAYGVLRAVFSTGFMSCLLGLVLTVSFVFAPFAITLRYALFSKDLFFFMVFSFVWLLYWIIVIVYVLKDA